MPDPDPRGEEPTLTGPAPGPGPWRPWRDPGSEPAEGSPSNGARSEPAPTDSSLWRPWLAQPAPADPAPADPAPPLPPAASAPSPVEAAPPPPPVAAAAPPPPPPAPPVEQGAPPPPPPTIEQPAVPPRRPEPPAPPAPLTATPAVTRQTGKGRRRREGPVKGRPPWRSALEWLGVVILALGAAFLVKTFVLQTFFIPSQSMEQTLLPGDRVFVNKLAYDFHSIHRGDIVVFTLPKGETAGPGIDDLIKRVIGLPGDTIEAVGGKVLINGKALDEPYLPPGAVTTLLPRQKVPAGRYFLMGDNRTDSRDSRYFGTIPGSDIVGRAFVRIWPLSRIGLL
ncbi:MAG TPA: signal peptidase I [Acidimicrobiales bacterium]|nr:signal peptidase I [Acidimicrobiales bacterium]